MMTRTERNKKQTAHQIVTAATHLFFKQGFEKTTFADIAMAVGISQPAIYAHFSNKMNLLKYVILQSAEIGREYIDGRMQTEKTPLKKLMTYSVANLDFFRLQKVHAHSLMALYYFGLNSHELKTTYLTIQQMGLERVKNLLVNATYANGKLLKDVDSVATILHTIIVGNCYKVVYAKSDAEARAITVIHQVAVENLILRSGSPTKIRGD